MLMGHMLNALKVQVDVVVSSPLKRALQTAQFVATELGYEGKVEISPALGPDADYADFQKMLARYADREGVLAVALNQDRASDVLRVAARVYPKRIYLEVKPGRTGAELELWSLRKEADYFREVFGRELFCTLA